MRPPLLAGCLCALAAIHGAPAQDRLPWWKVDPHTRNDPELMAVAGYESFARFMSRLKKRSSRDVLALTRQALDSAYGLNVVGFDDAWIEWLDR